MFDEFLKENDKNSVEAIKMQVSTNYSSYPETKTREHCLFFFHFFMLLYLIFDLLDFHSAEAETKLKLEKVAEIKKINAQMMAIKR